MESVLGYKQKISFVSTFCLGRRLYVIDHATISVDHEIIYPLQTGQRLRSKSMGVGWGQGGVMNSSIAPNRDRAADDLGHRDVTGNVSREL